VIGAICPPSWYSVGHGPYLKRLRVLSICLSFSYSTASVLYITCSALTLCRHLFPLVLLIALWPCPIINLILPCLSLLECVLEWEGCACEPLTLKTPCRSRLYIFRSCWNVVVTQSKWYRQEVIGLGVPMVERPPYILQRRQCIYNCVSNTISIKNPAQPVALLMLWCGGLGADWWGRDFGAKGGSALCNKRRSHVIEKVVLSTWKKYYNYQKIEGIRVMSTTDMTKRCKKYLPRRKLVFSVWPVHQIFS
jgi:hypothetical protein